MDQDRYRRCLLDLGRRLTLFADTKGALPLRGVFPPAEEWDFKGLDPLGPSFNFDSEFTIMWKKSSLLGIIMLWPWL